KRSPGEYLPVEINSATCSRICTCLGFFSISEDMDMSLSEPRMMSTMNRSLGDELRIGQVFDIQQEQMIGFVSRVATGEQDMFAIGGRAGMEMRPLIVGIGLIIATHQRLPEIQLPRFQARKIDDRRLAIDRRLEEP